MSVNSTLHFVRESGWRTGFANFLRKENGIWWRTRKWWVQSLVWFFVLNGLVVLLLWIIPAVDPGGSPPPREVYDVFFNLFAVSSLGVMVLMQGVIVNEKESGTAAWIMTNPISRPAFILAKFLAHSLGIFAIIVVMQGVIAYVQFSLKAGSPLPAPPFVTAIGIHGLHILFYICLTIMLGTMFQKRGPVIGISIALFICQDIVAQILVRFVPRSVLFFPSTLSGMAVATASGRPLDSVVPIVATCFYSIVFLLISVWRFGRDEF